MSAAGKSTSRNDSKPDQGISGEKIFYAGLGVLRDSPRDFERLTATGRALVKAEFGSGKSHLLSDLLRGKVAGVSASQAVRIAAQAVARKEARKFFGLPDAHDESWGGEVAEPAVGVAVREPPSLMPEMIEAMMPRTVPTAAAVLQARRNSAARTALVEEFGLLSSLDVA
ncbi:MAG TPA: hypothetical protein VJG13_10955, partial [Thermoanaerobaculia bacterium]|nr:hypothetical protein [Thermoanaerobaculia bacterium]